MIPETKLFGKVEVDRIVHDKNGKPSIVACWGKHKHLIANIVLRNEKSEKWLVIEVDEKTYQDFLCRKINHDQVFQSSYQYGILIEHFQNGKVDLTYYHEDKVREKFFPILDI